jgi:hypothetical protein
MAEDDLAPEPSQFDLASSFRSNSSSSSDESSARQALGLARLSSPLHQQNNNPESHHVAFSPPSSNPSQPRAPPNGTFSNFRPSYSRSHSLHRPAPLSAQPSYANHAPTTYATSAPTSPPSKPTLEPSTSTATLTQTIVNGNEASSSRTLHSSRSSPDLASTTPLPPMTSRQNAYNSPPDAQSEEGEADAESVVDGNGGTLDLHPNLGDSKSFLAGTAPYLFPRHRLKNVWEDQTKTPLVIVACGSFSPPTYLHLWVSVRSFAKRQVETRIELITLLSSFVRAGECLRWPKIRSSRTEITRS